jgi:predicted O-linked N-acetylglucosamine transferase (SPINDLY family)
LNRKARRAAKRSHAVGGVSPAAGQQATIEAIRGDAFRQHQAGRFREADAACRRLLALAPQDIAGLHLAGLLALQGGRNEAALEALSAAVGLNDGIPDLHAALGEALQRLGRFDESLDHYRRALALDQGDPETLYNCGNVLLKLRRYEEAIAAYDRALARAPRFAEALNNRGNALFELKRYPEALGAFDGALAIKSQFPMALANRGTVLSEFGRHDDAVTSCNAALVLDPRNVPALAARGNAFFELRRFAEAARDFEQVLALDPDHSYAAAKPLYYRLLCCDWTNYARDIASVGEKIASGKRASIPFMALNLTDSAALCRQAAVTFSDDKYPTVEPIWRGERYVHPRIRVAYLSADFRQHPMAYAMAGVFEVHDRSRFETIAVSFGPDQRDAMRLRLEPAFDRFLDVRTTPDRDIAMLLRELEVDIAVDLMGYTNNSRPGNPDLSAGPDPGQLHRFCRHDGSRSHRLSHRRPLHHSGSRTRLLHGTGCLFARYLLARGQSLADR